MQLSIIIPIALTDRSWQQLLPQLESFALTGIHYEIILAAQLGDDIRSDKARIAFSPIAGRAQQMNHAVTEARGEWLWFLHGDSQLNAKVIQAVLQTVQQASAALYYFNLKFDSSGPALMWLNGWGVWLRCVLFQCPFGDQGFLMPKRLFERCGGYDETLAYGEDHLLVWQARYADIPIRRLPQNIATSPRKYATNGWATTTVNHIKLWCQQAWPAYKALRRQRSCR